MRPQRSVIAVVLSAAALFGTAACRGEPEPSTSPVPSTTVSPSPTAPSASPSPSLTYTAKEQEAIAQATTTVETYRQIVIDLYSGARTRINDLDEVTTGDFHDEEVKAVSQGLAQGFRTTPKGVEVRLVSAEPVSVNLTKDPPTVVVKACFDGTDATVTDPDGNKTSGIREELSYTVVYTTYREIPVWAVSRVRGAAEQQDRSC